MATYEDTIYTVVIITMADNQVTSSRQFVSLDPEENDEASYDANHYMEEIIEKMHSDRDDDDDELDIDAILEGGDYEYKGQRVLKVVPE